MTARVGLHGLTRTNESTISVVISKEMTCLFTSPVTIKRAFISCITCINTIEYKNLKFPTATTTTTTKKKKKKKQSAYQRN